MWCGGMVGPPELSQVPLCPKFDIKFKKKFMEFFEDFSEIDKRLKTRENEYEQ
jgi:hypothetical protein